MAQDQRRDQMVRLPNPSAQPFVAALKTARFFAVLFFWVTMVCVLAHAATFVLTEWVHLYDVAVPEPAPVVAPAAPAAPSVEEKTPAGQVRVLALFEGVAAAAEPGELFPNVPSQPSPKAPAKEAAPAPAEADEKIVPPPAEATEGTIVGEPEQPA
ncbi:MAG: hypothetical protein IMZ66_00065, partial [Planctomycetes bacterium]|nr:hypothetical protein [Planctomycetota bacterium]